MGSGVQTSSELSEVMLRSALTDEDVELRGEMRIGREKDCEIQVDDRHISRYHAKLTVTEDGILLEDLRSTNGTYVNGYRIQAPQSVSVGDELRFHNHLFRLVSNGSSGMDATVFGWPVEVDLPPRAVPEIENAAPRVAEVSPSRQSLRDSPSLEVAQLGPLFSDSNVSTQDESAPVQADPFLNMDFMAADMEGSDTPPPPLNSPRQRDNRPSAIERQMRRQDQGGEDYMQRVLDLPSGTWMALCDDEMSPVTLCKLAARSKDGTRLYFVSDMGLRIFEKSSRELAQDLQFNRAHSLDRGPLLGRLAIRLTGAERRVRNAEYQEAEFA